jgi:hypothetical protein
MPTEINVGDDFVAGIAPTTAPKNLLPSEHGLKHDFKPWHKPRKHWIRINQWCAETTELIKQFKKRENKVLTYLSLPGPDMLDIRALHDECNKQGYSIKYLGFNDPSVETDNEQTELNISRNELANLPGIHPDSQIVPDRFEAIASTEKVAYQHLENFGSFDVVNLDLCNSVAAHVPLERQETYFSAIAALVEHQSKNRTAPWLLFVTTRVNDSTTTVNPNALRKLLECLKANIQQHPQFRTDLNNVLRLDAAMINDAVSGSKKLKPKELYHAFTVAFGKWLLRYLASGAPTWTLDMLSSWAYHVHHQNDTPDMLSLAYKCMPIVKPKTDHFKLGHNPHGVNTQASISERDAALKLIPIVQDVRNLDIRLKNDANELKTIVDEAAKLMELARYDRNAYIKTFSHG